MARPGFGMKGSFIHLRSMNEPFIDLSDRVWKVVSCG